MVHLRSDPRSSTYNKHENTVIGRIKFICETADLHTLAFFNHLPLCSSKASHSSAENSAHVQAIFDTSVFFW